MLYYYDRLLLLLFDGGDSQQNYETLATVRATTRIVRFAPHSKSNCISLSEDRMFQINLCGMLLDAALHSGDPTQRPPAGPFEFVTSCLNWVLLESS